MPELERRIIAGRLAYEITESEEPGHATAIAREALAAGDRFLVAVGGDGTINEVVNGMIEDDRLIAEDSILGVVSAGSGSDFVKTFGLPDGVITAVRHLLTDRAYPIDIGKVTYQEAGAERTRYFANVAEAGLGGRVVRRAERLPRWLGRGRYFLGFWLALARHKAGEVTVRADRREFRGEANNVVVANCQFYGGGMRISPRSYPSDGKFDVQISTGPKSQAFTLLPKIYRGDHIPNENIKEMLATTVTVEAERPLPVEVDGEPLGATPARFEILHELLRLKI